MSILTFVSLVCYILLLAATQTVYGEPFMNYRWYALLIFVAVSGADWVVQRIRKERQPAGNASFLLMLYFAATGISVLFAENWHFSGMRWVAHGIMLVAFMLFLRQIASPIQMNWILLLLKTSAALLLVTSWLAPAKATLFEDSNYRGAMGDSNSMGHIAVIAALLFFHALMTGKKHWIGYLNGALAFSAMATVWYSGARSSMIALIAGLTLMTYLYRHRTSGAVVWILIVVGLSALVFPGLPDEIVKFAVKKKGNGEAIQEQIIKTRAPLWLQAFEGFKGRPLYGWGFGADSSIEANWTPKLTALGAVQRDATNDLLLMMEGCGVLGIIAYLLLINLAIRQAPGKRTRRGFEWNALVPFPLMSGGPPQHHIHAIFFILSISLLVLTQFDGSGLSAGSFISAVLWLSAGSAGAIKSLTVYD